LSGRLDAEAGAEVRRTLGDLESVVSVDVSELGVVDPAGLALLAELRTAGIALEGLSPYLQLRMDLRAQTEGRGPGGSSSEAAEKKDSNAVHRGRGEDA